MKYPSSVILSIIALSLIILNYTEYTSIKKVVCLFYLHDNTAILYIHLVLDWR